MAYPVFAVGLNDNGMVVLEDGRDDEEHILSDDQAIRLASCLGYVLPDDDEVAFEAARMYLQDEAEIELDTDDADHLELMEEIGIDPDRIAKAEFDEIVDALVDEIDGERTSIEGGEYDGPVDYRVEISSTWVAPKILGNSVTLGGWVILQKIDWTVWADLVMLVDGDNVMGTSMFRAQYDRDRDEWPVFEIEQL